MINKKLYSLKTLAAIAFFLLIGMGSCKKNNPLTLVEPTDVAAPDSLGAGIDKYLKLFFNYSDSNYYFLQQEIKTLYKNNDYQSIWFSDFALTPAAKAILDTLQQSHHYGLHPDLYLSNYIKINLEKIDTTKKISLKRQSKTAVELMISFSLINFLTHIKTGVVRGKEVWSSQSEVFLRSKIMDGFQLISKGEPIHEVMSSLQPKSYNYLQLSNALKKVELPEKWPETESILNVNNQTPRMVLTVLQISGFFKGNIDKHLSQYKLVLKSYQKHNHLPLENLSNTTRIYLITQIYQKFMIMAVNIERMRQNPILNNNHLFVNLPAFKLTIFENGIPLKNINVIVGALKTPTPILSGALTHVVTYPTWNMPPSIVYSDVIPAIKRDSSYLKRKGYYVTNWQGDVLNLSDININAYNLNYHPFNIAQGSGSDNALGTIKFLFQNDYDIYLHDTNQRNLFQNKERALSHGCIRVEKPEELASYLLGESLSADMLDKMAKKETNYFKLEKEVFVYLRYLTCEANDNGDVTYYKDVYQLDQKDWALMMRSLYFNSKLAATK